MNNVYSEYIDLLRDMISLPSPSGEEDRVAGLVQSFLSAHGCIVERRGNNILVRPINGIDDRPTLLLNSHIDTVRPVDSWSKDPFNPEICDGKLYGLGSNDAGASVVSLIAAFLALRNDDLPVNLMLALSAEEERSGENGFRKLLPELGRVDMAIVGEPTGMQAATGERGLVVLDCVSKGISGHAARNDGENAIYKAIKDIETLRNFRFPKVSTLLGDISFNITQIEAGYRHNVIPDECRWVVDIRTTDAYTNEETVEIIKELVGSEIRPRSTRIRASAICADHLLVRAAVRSGSSVFLSPTTSDMALMPFPSLKLGPGDSKRSHTADEYIQVSEIEEGIDKYKEIIENIRL